MAQDFADATTRAIRATSMAKVFEADLRCKDKLWFTSGSLEAQRKGNNFSIPTNLFSYSFSLPSLEIQNKLTKELNKVRTYCHNLELEYFRKINSLEELKKSISFLNKIGFSSVVIK